MPPSVQAPQDATAVREEAPSPTPSRGLGTEERALLQFLLDEPFLGRDELRQQMESVQVIGACPDGCPTVALAVDRSLVSTPPDALTVPVEAEGRDADGMPILVALHAADGYLQELEIVRFDGEAPRSFPRPDSLRRRLNLIPDSEGSA